MFISKVLVSRARTKMGAYANSFFAGIRIGVGGMDDGAIASLVTIVSVGMLFFLVFTLPVTICFGKLTQLFVEDHGNLCGERACFVRTMDRFVGLVDMMIVEGGHRYAYRSARYHVSRHLKGAL